MSNKVSFANLKLKPKFTTKAIDFNGTTIEVDQYLDIANKNDLVAVTLQKAKENGYYNQVKLEMYFHLNLVYLYTNISFTEKQREDEEKLYDTLTTTGLMGAVLQAIPEDEYHDLMDYVRETIDAEMEYNKSIGAVVAKVIQDLPANAQAAAEIMQNFDPKQFKNVIDFARAANGGRDIKLNTPVEDFAPTAAMEDLLAPAT